MTIIYYYTSVSSNMETKKHQQRIEMVLDSKKIEYERCDIASSEEDKKKMRDLMGDAKALPPQLFNGDQYLGEYTAFEAAVENGELEKFLKLE